MSGCIAAVAMLVAERATADEFFAAVAEEVARHLRRAGRRH